MMIAIRTGRRRGMTMILVLGVLAITIALSYAIMRTQVTSAQIHENIGYRDNARQAAMTGLMIGLRKMRTSGWGGVGTQFGGTLGDGTNYQVAYEAGDAELQSGDADYEKYPFRVTVTATGFALDGATSQTRSTHQMQAVVELTPRALSSQPSNWASLQGHTVHQWKNTDVVVQTPVRVEGPVALQGPVKLCEDYPPTSRPWDGKIDEVVIIDRALSQTEIQGVGVAALLGKIPLIANVLGLSPTHYWSLNESNGATVAVDSAGGANGTYENGTIAGVSGFGVGNTCAEFDGRNDYIHVGNLDITGDEITMLAYFKADSWDASPYARIISKATGTSNDYHYWMLSTAPSGGSIRIRSRIRTNGSTTALVASSGNLLPGVWYLAAAVYDGTDMILYLDGVEVGRTSKSGNLDQNSAVPVYIGESPPGSPQTRLLRDLEAMRVAGLDDWRPLEGPVDMPLSNTDDSTLAMLQEDLNLTTNDVAVDNSSPLSHPGAVATYQLYTGGPTYAVTSLGGGDHYEDLAADPKSNPLGVVHVTGAWKLQDGVSVEGTIIMDGSGSDLCIEGDNISLSPVAMPPIYGATSPVELPVAVIADDIRIDEATGVAISGVVYTGDEFTFESGSQASQCDLSGLLLAGELQFFGRTEWNSVSNGQWESWLTQFVNQLAGGSPEPYFPNWLSDNHSLSSEPLLTIKPRPDAVTFHWQDWTQPVFVAHGDDEGLLWKVIRITDVE